MENTECVLLTVSRAIMPEKKKKKEAAQVAHSSVILILFQKHITVQAIEKHSALFP